MAIDDGLTAPKTVRVRIALVVDKDGDWCVSGWANADSDEEKFDDIDDHFGGDMEDQEEWIIVADVPIPGDKERPVIEGRVRPYERVQVETVDPKPAPVLVQKVKPWWHWWW